MKPSRAKSTTTSSSIASYFKQPKQTTNEESNHKRSNSSESAQHECPTMPSPPKKKLKTVETSPQAQHSAHKAEKENKESMDCHHYSKVARNNCSLSEQELNSIFEHESELLLNHLDMFESKLTKSKQMQTSTTTRTTATNEDCKEFPSFLYMVRKINKLETKCLVELFLTRIENEQANNELSKKRQSEEDEEDELKASDGTRCNLHDSW